MSTRRDPDLRQPVPPPRGPRRPPPKAPSRRPEPSAAAPSRPRRERGEGWLYGRHAVAAALANPRRRWRRIAVLPALADEAAALAAAALAERHGAGEPVERLDRAALNLLLPEGAVHQGWAVEVDPLEPVEL